MGVRDEELVILKSVSGVCHPEGILLISPNA